MDPLSCGFLPAAYFCLIYAAELLDAGIACALTLHQRFLYNENSVL